jgi:hypothetical protein
VLKNSFDAVTRQQRQPSFFDTVRRQCVASVVLLLVDLHGLLFISFTDYSKRTKTSFVSLTNTTQHIRALSSLVSSLLFLNLQETEEIKMSQCSVNLFQCLAVQIV